MSGYPLRTSYRLPEAEGGEERKPRVHSASELSRAACVEQAKAMRLLAGQLRTSIDALAVFTQSDSGLRSHGPHLTRVASVENALLSIATELERMTPP